MNLTDLETLVEFHYWATRHVLDAVEQLSPEQFTRDLGNSYPSVRDTLAHLYGANQRVDISGLSPSGTRVRLEIPYRPIWQPALELR